MKKYHFHRFANIFPLADHGIEFEALLDDIRHNGLLQPIVLYEGAVLDGRRRYLACQKAGVSPTFVVWDGSGLPVDFVISINAVRRQLSPSQLAVAALKSLPFFEKASKERQRLSKGRAKKVAQGCATLKGKATEWVAKRFGISVRIVEMAKAVQKARPKVVTEIGAGLMSVSKAYEAITGCNSSNDDAPSFSAQSPSEGREQLRAQLGPDYYCFATPEWVRKAIAHDYGYPELDVAANHGSHFGKRHYEPKQNGLRQNWRKDSNGGLVWCNPPYNCNELGKWVDKCWKESQKGCTVIAALPFWRKYDWFKNIVRAHAEVRLAYDEVVCDGFGPMKGRRCGNTYWRNEYETVFAIFRPKQSTGYCGAWLKPAVVRSHSKAGRNKAGGTMAA